MAAFDELAGRAPPPPPAQEFPARPAPLAPPKHHSRHPSDPQYPPPPPPPERDRRPQEQPRDDSERHQQQHPATPSARFALITAEEAARELATDPAQGLKLGQVVAKRAAFGLNELRDDSDSESLLQKFLEQFTGNPLILLLLGSASISVMMGQWDDAFSITLAIVIVVIVAFVQEYRSEQSLQALNRLVPHHCHVVRGGKSVTVEAAELVPGDLVHFSVGDRIPADIRLLTAVDLEVDESNLTGETTPRRKDASVMQKQSYGDLSLDERNNVVFMGTLVRSGHGTGITVATGKQTEFGAVFCMMKEVENRKTPLQTSMNVLGKQLSILSMAIISLIVVVGVIQGRSVLKMFNIGVSLAVAAIPEGLPIVVTVTLALGVLRMANRHVIVKRLPSVETLGSMTVICADKTGTLTLNRMTVTHLFTVADDMLFDLEKGRQPADISSHQALGMLLTIGALCNNAYWDEHDKILGHPTDVALLEVAHKLGGEDTRSDFERIQEMPFNSDNKYMSTTCRHPPGRVPHIGPPAYQGGVPVSGGRLAASFAVHQDGEVTEQQSRQRPPSRAGTPSQERSATINSSSITQYLQKSTALSAPVVSQPQSAATTTVFLKGALEVVMERCSTYLTSARTAVPFDAATQESVAQRAESLASGGLRIVAAAFGKEDSAGAKGDMCFVGFFAMYDPPRRGIDRTITELLGGGVRVVMITGDAESTALSIARKLGIPTSGLNSCLTGPQLDSLSEWQLQEAIKSVTVFARTTPKHKMIIVRAFQAAGEVVAMTGDGVNDAPALKLADIGISMGRSGTDVAKEAADMILVNDDFSMVLNAIEEGKSIYYNIQNFLRFQLSTSISALVLIATSTLFGLDNPLNAMQILWINILMDGPPAQSLGVEPVDHDVMRRPPRPKSVPMLTRRVVKRVATSATMIFLGTMFVYVTEMQDGNVNARDITMTFTTFVLFDMFNALSCRSESKSIFLLGVFSNRMFNAAVAFSLLGQLLVIYVPFFQRVFQTAPLTAGELLRLVAISSSVFWVDEARKWYNRSGAKAANGGEYRKVSAFDMV